MHVGDILGWHTARETDGFDWRDEPEAKGHACCCPTQTSWTGCRQVVQHEVSVVLETTDYLTPCTIGDLELQLADPWICTMR